MCRRLSLLPRRLAPQHDVGEMDQRCAASKQYSLFAQTRREKNGGRPARIIVSPSADPYQSDEAARLTRQALLILEQYHLRVQVHTLCGMRSVRDFDILARNRWQYATAIYFQEEKLREEWEPGAAPIIERIKALKEAHAAGIYTWVKTHPTAYPAELIDVVESLRADVDAWSIGRSLPGGPLMKAKVGRRPSFVDADTALAYLRGMVELGLSDKLHRAEEMKIWSPDKKDRGESGRNAREQRLNERRALGPFWAA